MEESIQPSETAPEQIPEQPSTSQPHDELLGAFQRHASTSGLIAVGHLPAFLQHIQFSVTSGQLQAALQHLRPRNEKMDYEET
jgi:hypothetical protein